MVRHAWTKMYLQTGRLLIYYLLFREKKRSHIKLTWVALIVKISEWYSTSNNSGNLSLTLIPRWYNSSSPLLISSPPCFLPFQGDCHPENHFGMFCKEESFSDFLASFRRASKRIANWSNSLIRFLVGERVPCLAYDKDIQNLWRLATSYS